MTPDAHPTLLQRAEKLELDAQVEHVKQNHVYAQDLAREAHHLRMEHQQEQAAKEKTP